MIRMNFLTGMDDSLREWARLNFPGGALFSWLKMNSFGIRDDKQIIGCGDTGVQHCCEKAFDKGGSCGSGM